MTRRRARASERGTAMVEALSVNMILIILLAGMILFQVLYGGKQRASGDARALAWSYAYNGCNTRPATTSASAPTESADAPPDTSSAMAADGPGPSSTSTGQSTVDGDPQYQSLFAGSHGVVSYTGKVTVGAFKPLQIPGATFLGVVSVMCNETAEIGDPTSFLHIGKELVSW